MPGLYETALAPAWAATPRTVRRVHEPGECGGAFEVERGRGLLTTAIAALCGLPPAGLDVPVRLRVTDRDGGQQWERWFGERRLTSWQGHAGPSAIVERYGVVECRLLLAPADGGFTVRSAAAALRIGPLRVPLPAVLAPAIEGRIAAAGDAVAVDVAIRTAWRALLLRYRGHVRGEAAP